MAITTGKNTSYGPPLVNQKYAPLHNISWQEADRPIYVGLLKNRATQQSSSGLRSGGLDLAMPDWNAAITAERAALRLPPLVVVSSNRSKWIKTGLAAGALQLQALGIGAFNNECDLRALSALSGQKQSPPLYAPARVGAGRGIYVVVHMAEYEMYKTTLAGTGITPVGWQFKRTGGPRGIDIVGFGASRFAAMELCKQLYSLAPVPAPPPIVAGNAPWTRAWLIDDNVVAITAFPGFAAIEAAAAPTDVASGFSGGTNAEAQTKIRDWARGEIQNNRNGPQPIKVSNPPGIIQQTALWNVQYFTANHLNFSPAYVASAEDLSITNYFDVSAIPYKFYEGNTVTKELPEYDNGKGAKKVNTLRASMNAWVSAAEAATPPTPPPPPVKVLPRDDDDGGEQDLATFIVAKVLPASAMKDDAGKVTVQDAAKCQAVEQLTCGGIKNGLATASLDTTFKINGAANQAVNRHNVP